MTLSLVATCALGLEALLADELRTLDVADPAPQRGAVRFRGGWRDVWRANWRLRTANRVLVRLAAWPAEDGDALYAGARALAAGDRRWDGVDTAGLLAPEATLAVRASSHASQVRDVRWAALKIKDGLVDGQRARFGRRASVDRSDPDRPLRLWLDHDRATLLLDTSGRPLDRRGYRVKTASAPVREQLAAACVLAAGWDGRGPVVDPMCGTGTLLIEAAAIALGRAPGALGGGFRFERLPGFDAEVYARIRAEPIPAPGPEVWLYGVDRDRHAVEAAHANLTRAGLDDRAQVKRGDGYAFTPPETPGLLLVNPAYGERLSRGEDQWRRLGDLLKARYKGWRAVVLAGGEGKGKGIGLRTSKRVPVKNGPLDARIMVFDLY